MKINKLFFGAAILFIGLLLANNQVFADNNTPKESIISAQANAEQTVIPDTVEISFTIETRDKNSQKAVDKNSQTANNIIANVKKILGDNETIKTNSYSMTQTYEYNKTLKKSELSGYLVTNGLTVKLKDKNKVSKVIDIATTNGATRVSGLKFTVQSTDNVCRQLTAKAAQKAKADAAAIVTPLGGKIDRIVGISYSCSTENRMNTRFTMSAKALGASNEEDTVTAPEIEAGEIKVRAHVNIEFAIK